jgi:hypothetical protein
MFFKLKVWYHALAGVTYPLANSWLSSFYQIETGGGQVSVKKPAEFLAQRNLGELGGTLKIFFDIQMHSEISVVGPSYALAGDRRMLCGNFSIIARLG